MEAVARAAAALAALAALAACKQHERAPAPPDSIPATRDAIDLDGELHEPDWNARAPVHAFLSPEGAVARPYSEVRFLHDASTLYLGLYAADQDIHGDEVFTVQLGARALTVDAAGRVHGDALPGAAARVDLDGTLDDPRDEDEEWVVELSIPLAALPPGPLPLTASRCDTPKDGIKRCGSWTARAPLALEPQP